MKDYLKRFETYNLYNNWKSSIRYIEPNISLIENEGLEYNPIIAKYDYSQQYLTFEAIEDTTFTFEQNALQYSLDNGISWITLSANTSSPIIKAGNKILWKQTGLIPSSNTGIGTFFATGNFKASGNIMSLYYGDNFVWQTDLTGKNWAFYGLFHHNTKLVDAQNIILPATTLTDSCYSYMFAFCTSLIQGPALPATTLANSCYWGMFNGCTSLTQATTLPATTLAAHCYQYMFGDCTSLAQAPELPTMTLTYQCYLGMFYGCTSLTQAPTLPAIRLAEDCYQSMFYGCTALTQAPELPAMTLANNCYYMMFSDCISLTQAPVLPATTLTYSCYSGMFLNCTSLTQAPALPATTLVSGCYDTMFMGCTNLTSITCLATDISASNFTYNWLSGVAVTGTFVKNVNISWNMGPSGIPDGWIIRFYGYNENNYAYNKKLYLESGFPYMLDNNFLNQFIGYDLYVDNIYIGKIEQNINGNYYI